MRTQYRGMQTENMVLLDFHFISPENRMDFRKDHRNDEKFYKINNNLVLIVFFFTAWFSFFLFYSFLFFGCIRYFFFLTVKHRFDESGIRCGGFFFSSRAIYTVKINGVISHSVRVLLYQDNRWRNKEQNEKWAFKLLHFRVTCCMNERKDHEPTHNIT